VQSALWELGGCPKLHNTDCTSAAVHKQSHPDRFTDRYKALLEHYNMKGRHTEPGHPNQNGIVEQSHHRFKSAINQALILRGTREFSSIADYSEFLQKVCAQKNSCRKQKLAEEIKALLPLPSCKIPEYKEIESRVGKGSTVRVLNNIYSVPSRLIGELVRVRIYANAIKIFYAQKQQETYVRLKGEHQSHINYRHVIKWLIRKPGAFAHYLYRSDLFPSSWFRMGYDLLKKRYSSNKADREYLQILYLAATRSESKVENFLKIILEKNYPLNSSTILEMLDRKEPVPDFIRDTSVSPVSLQGYDILLKATVKEVAHEC
jgi:hypothetical protein